MFFDFNITSGLVNTTIWQKYLKLYALVKIAIQDVLNAIQIVKNIMNGVNQELRASNGRYNKTRGIKECKEIKSMTTKN